MALTIVTQDAWTELRRRIEAFQPRSRLGKVVRLCFDYLPPALAGELLEAVTSALVVESSLSLVVYRRCQRCGGQTGPSHLGVREDPCHPELYQPCRCPAYVRAEFVEPLGVVSTRVVTNNGVAYLVDAWQNLVELENERYHAIGTGTAAEAAADAALAAEITSTQYQGGARATGSLGEGSGANVFRTVGTNTVTASLAITEHGIFSSATIGAGTLWDRSVFSAVNLASGDSLQSTYDMTASAGG